MHEYPATCRIVELASKRAAEANAPRVKAISLVIGDDAGYVGDSICLYFDAVAQGTPCEGAELIVRRVVPQLRCTSCGSLFVRKPFSFSCPHCGGDGRPSEIGKEFFVESIEVIPNEENPPCPNP